MLKKFKFVHTFLSNFVLFSYLKLENLKFAYDDCKCMNKVRYQTLLDNFNFDFNFNPIAFSKNKIQEHFTQNL